MLCLVRWVRVGAVRDDTGGDVGLSDQVLQNLLCFWHTLAIAGHQVAKRILGFFTCPRPQVWDEAYEV